MPDPKSRAHPPWLTRGRTPTQAATPAPPAGYPYPYYLPTIVRPQAPRYPEEPWSQRPTMTEGVPNSYWNPPPQRGAAPQVLQAGAPAPTHEGGTFAPAAAPTEAGTALTPARAFGRWGYGASYVLNPENYGQQPARQYAPPEAPETTTTPAAGGGGGGGGAAPPPAGVDAYWYAEFQRQHNGMTPEQYYAQTGENLAHALADEEWARGFAEMYGRPPNDYDWRAHWFSSRIGYTPEEYEKWKMEQIARRVVSESQAAQPATAAPTEEEEEEEQRPPVYAPPFIVWR